MTDIMDLMKTNVGKISVQFNNICFQITYAITEFTKKLPGKRYSRDGCQ